MERIFGAFAYGAGPREGCWWDATCDMPKGDTFDDSDVDVAIIGGGFTGLNAALVLARAGMRTAVLEAEHFGWGASGRNGGFCCLGGGVASDRALDVVINRSARLAFRRAEVAAVSHVEALIADLGIEVDRHSRGETELAHRPKDMEHLRKRADTVAQNYQVTPQLLEAHELAGAGFGAGPFYGALTVPIGFGLNPRKYLAGLVLGARNAGASLFENSRVTGLETVGQMYDLAVNGSKMRARHVVIATNGYSSEDMPPWFDGRYMPCQSTVLVTRPLSIPELAAQGWTTEQMSYDTRNLLHYFRLMPDRRFLFGMRGGLRSSPGAEAAARARTRIHFERMFPEWAGIETTHTWSGFVALARRKVPFIGPVPDMPNVWAALCYHGNGVAMGSYAGRLLAERLLGQDAGTCPEVMALPLLRFPMGRWRRLLMPPLYSYLKLKDIS